MKKSILQTLLRTASIMVLSTISSCCVLAGTLDSRVSGKGSPNLTLTYNVSIHNKLSDLSDQQIADDVNGWYKLARQMPGPPIPESVKQAEINQLKIEARSTPSNQVNLILAVRGNELLVKQYWSQGREVNIFLYDGQRSLDLTRGYDAQIDAGFQYNYLRNFMFPGISVCGIPLVKKLFFTHKSSEDNNEYMGMVAADDGASETSGLPQYRPGIIKTQDINGFECITETHAGSIEALAALHAKVIAPNAIRGPEQECYYAGYRRVSPNLMLPTSMKIVESYTPANILPFGPYLIIKYSLQEASSTALPQEQFNPEEQLPSGTIVQRDAKTGTSGIQFVRGKSLDQQFESDRQRRESKNLLHTPDTKKRTSVGLFISLAAIAALCGWYLFKRSKTSTV